MTTFPIVEVHWRDAIGSDGWVTIEEILDTESTVHVQVGYLIDETDREVKLCMSYNEDLSNMGAYVVLPKSMILNMRQVDVTRVVLGTMEVKKT